ncbi:unnamed protein product, partial [Didymodactylos carnosus]
MSNNDSIIATKLENMPDELILECCTYLAPYHVLLSLFGLNTRLNCTITEYRQNILIDGTSTHLINRGYHYINSTLLPMMGYQVYSLTIVNPQESPLIKIDQHTPNLEQLTFINCSINRLQFYLSLLSSLKQLKELVIDCFRINCIEKIINSNKYVNRIWISDNDISLNDVAQYQYKHLTNLTIPLENVNDLLILFKICPNIQYLNVHLKTYCPLSLDECTQLLKLNSLNLIAIHLKTPVNSNIQFDELALIVKQLSTLEHLSIDIHTN